MSLSRWRIWVLQKNGFEATVEDDQPAGAATETHNATREQEHKV